jgi:hypothetical protein
MRCEPPYRELRGVCVHDAYADRTSQAGLEAQVDLYLRGGAAPRVGRALGQPAGPLAAISKLALAPGALSARRPVSEQEAAEAKARRLKALDEMLAAAQAEIARKRRRVGGSSATADSHQGSAGQAGAGPEEQARTAQLLDAIKQMSQSQADTMLKRMEGRGMRQELGEEVWQQLNGAPRGGGDVP